MATVSFGFAADAQRSIGASERRFWADHRGGVLVASGGGVSTRFGSGGPRVRVPGGAVALRLAGVGYGAAVARVPGVGAPVADRAQVRYRHGGLVEWYRNGPLGLEQGFTLTRRPAGRRVGPLTLAMAVNGSLVARRSAGQIEFVSRSGAVRLRYGLRKS